MKVVALISGGKDSCYNMMQCVAAGHELVALANLHPESKADELDSYMYQTVGHQGVELYADAMCLPLYRQKTQGVALQLGKVYTPTAEDEVEDLYQLLRRVKEEVDIDAVAVGAILSDYQRIRVENVCNRLGLVAVAYLWRRDQAELLQEMIDCKVKAIVIKVAAMGLDPSKHLGLTLVELQPIILKMKEKYGLNIAGEGGEFESYVLDCPLFIKRIVIDESETIIHSNDAIAPVGYLHFSKLHLVEKENLCPETSMTDRLRGCPVKTWLELISDLDEDVTENKLIGRSDPEDDVVDGDPARNSPENVSTPPGQEPLKVVWEQVDLPDCTAVKRNATGWCWFSGILGQDEDVGLATRQALQTLNTLLSQESLLASDLVAVTLYARDMSRYSAINTEYLAVFGGANPPVRVCTEVPLPAGTALMLEALAYSNEHGRTRHTMHVQGVSHWAPANIGPYSQAVRIGDIIYVAGQIALVPGTMQLVQGGARKQCRLALRHVGRIVRAMDPNTQLRDVVQGICYVTHPSYIPDARREWEKRTNNAIVDYLVVPQLPRGALLEWHIWAHRHNNRFEYEETGCCIGDYRVSIRRRWNYENNVAAVVCYVSTSSSTSSSTMSEDTVAKDPTLPQDITNENLSEVLNYALSKLLRKADPTTLCSLRVFYRVGLAPSPSRIEAVLSQLDRYSIVYSIIPVCQLHSVHTFLSICGVRHD